MRFFIQLMVAAMLAFLLGGCGQQSGNDRGTTPATGDGQTSSQPPAGDNFSRDCFWTIQTDPNVVNVLYPDQFAIYWVATITIPANGEVLLKGEYPHARYMSFNAYDPVLRPNNALADIDIPADVGSINTVMVGADRTAESRSYTARVVAAVPPENADQRQPGTLYSFQGQGDARAPSNTTNLIYRVYIPDTGRDFTGDVGLPRVVLKMADGSEVSGSDACSAENPPEVPSVVADAFAELGSDAGAAFTSFNDLHWLKFYGFGGSTANRFNATLLGGPARATPFNSTGNSGGFASNIHNAYVYSATSKDHGELAAFEAQFPQTPTTVDGDPVMDSGDMRYWSLCTYEVYSQRWIDCTYDEKSVRTTGNRGVFVISTPADRPNNATAECGANWLAWGPAKNSLLIMRHMLAEDGFGQSIQRVPGEPGRCEAPTMQRYFPYGTHFSKTDFEALGCPVLAERIPDVATQFPPTEECPQQPTGKSTLVE